MKEKQEKRGRKGRQQIGENIRRRGVTEHRT